MSLSRLFELIRDSPISGGAKMGKPREKTPGTPASRTWLVSHVPHVGLEPIPDTGVRHLPVSGNNLPLISE